MSPHKASTWLQDRAERYPYQVGVPLDTDVRAETLTPTSQFIRAPIQAFNVAIWAFETEEARSEFLLLRFGPGRGRAPEKSTEAVK